MLSPDLDVASQDEKRLYMMSQEAKGHSNEEERPDDAPRRPPGGGASAAQRSRKRSATSKSLDVETGGVEIFNENETTLYCVCQQPYNIDTSMIECDSCHEWYHVKCVGLSQVSIVTVPKHVDSFCTFRGHRLLKPVSECASQHSHLAMASWSASTAFTICRSFSPLN